MSNEKQSQTESKHYQIPMIISKEAISDFGIDSKDVKRMRIGSRSFNVVMVDATEEQFKAYMYPVWAEIKREDREGRCLITGKDGKLIRCPENKKCKECDIFMDICKEQNKPASLSFLVEIGLEPEAESSFENNVIYEIILNDLIRMLDEINPSYGAIFRLLYDGATQQEMADTLGIKQRTISDYVKRIRDILKPLAKDLFDM